MTAAAIAKAALQLVEVAAYSAFVGAGWLMG
jgi:hypothetical protein